jgi:hypothetical protein
MAILTTTKMPFEKSVRDKVLAPVSGRYGLIGFRRGTVDSKLSKPVTSTQSTALLEAAIGVPKYPDERDIAQEGCSANPRGRAPEKARRILHKGRSDTFDDQIRRY